MILNVYRVNKDLPEYMIINALECNSIWNIDPGIYKKIIDLEVEYKSVEELIEALENDLITEFEFEKSDIIEMLPDSEMLNNNLGIEDECNFIIITGLGCEQIAIDKEAVFREISFEALREMFDMK